ncbi:MAG: LysM peptidoglycan-binding domain-containing protein [Pirellulaceae bacterium]
MSEFRRIALLVFVMGACAAAPFYKPGAFVPPTNRKEANRPCERQKEELTLQVAARSESSPAERIAFPEPTLVEPAQNARSTPPTIRARQGRQTEQPAVRAHPTRQSEPPPRLALRYEPVPPRPYELASPFSLAPEPGIARSRISEQHESSSERSEPIQIRHRIVDGDTLKGLARKYLGDRTRAMEIFEANRDVLEDPEILPLGEALMIQLGEAQETEGDGVRG